MHTKQNRVLYLDGLRGLAATGVIALHLLAEAKGRYGAVYPFGDRYHFQPITSGWVGVELFFMISGFVILLTLERCTGFFDFILRRWLRLFPAMLIATILTFTFSRFLQPAEGFRHLPLRDVVPGLLFISPSFLHAALDIDVQSLEGVYWTLYVEAGFYAIFGILYFVAGWRWAVAGLALISLGALFGGHALKAALGTHPLTRAHEPFVWLGCHYYFWFVSGILFAKAKTLKSDRLFVLACALALVATAVTKLNPSFTPWSAKAAILCVAVLFAASQRVGWLQTALEWRPLLFLGFISYPLYLLHQNIGIGIIVHTQRRMPWLPIDLQWVPGVAAAIVLAWAVARFAEPPLRDALLKGLTRFKLVRQKRSA